MAGLETRPLVVDNYTLRAPATLQTWPSMPSAVTELNGTTVNRVWADLRGRAEVRLVVRVGAAGFVGPPAAKLRVQYAASDGGTWNDIGGAGPEPEVTITSANTTAKSVWVPIDPAALQNDVLLRVVGVDGNGTVTPSFGTLVVQFR